RAIVDLAAVINQRTIHIDAFGDGVARQRISGPHHDIGATTRLQRARFVVDVQRTGWVAGKPSPRFGAGDLDAGAAPVSKRLSRFLVQALDPDLAIGMHDGAAAARMHEWDILADAVI